MKDKLWGVYYTGPTAFEDGEDLVKLEAHLRTIQHGSSQQATSKQTSGARRPPTKEKHTT